MQNQIVKSYDCVMFKMSDSNKQKHIYETAVILFILKISENMEPQNIVLLLCDFRNLCLGLWNEHNFKCSETDIWTYE